MHEIAAQTSVLDGRTAPADESRDWLFGALFAQLVPPQRATVVVLEDVHWADESTLDFFRFIGRRIQRTGALLIATYRDEELSPIHPFRLALGELTGRHVIRMRLAPLSAAAVGEMAKNSGWNSALLHQITGGNPFFVSEALACPGERVPETVRDAVLARLMRCSAAARDLAELVSIAENATAVLKYAPLAAKEATRLGAHRQAVAHLSAALHYHDSLPGALQAEYFERHAKECSLTNQPARAIVSGEQALDLWRLEGNIEAQARVLNFLTPEYRTSGDKVGANKSSVDAIALLEPLAPSIHLAMAYGARCRLAANRGMEHDAVDFGTRALVLALEFGDKITETLALSNIGTASVIAGDGARLALDRGDWAGAAQILFELSQTVEHVPVQRVPSRATLALLRIRRGDPGADDLLNEVYDLAMSMDEPERVGRITAARAEQAWYRGRAGLKSRGRCR